MSYLVLGGIKPRFGKGGRLFDIGDHGRVRFQKCPRYHRLQKRELSIVVSVNKSVGEWLTVEFRSSLIFPMRALAGITRSG